MTITRAAQIIFLLFSTTFWYAQNGKILNKEEVKLSDEKFWKNITNNNILVKEYQYLDSLNFYKIEYLSDGIKIKGYVIEPKRKGIFPVIIFNRGGNRTYSELSIGTLVNYTSKLANAGYIIIGSNYREKDEFGGNEINDVLILTETIKEIEKADSNNIGMFGWSRGGMMTYLALKNSNKIVTAVVGNAPSDLFSTIDERPEMETNPISECIPDYWKNKELELKKRSAIYWVDKLNKESSLLVLCGTKDTLVNPQQSESISAKLQEINYNFKLVKVETNHFFSDKKTELNDLLINWFNEKLKNSNNFHQATN